MKALSFKPPWGFLCAVIKDVENRSWPLWHYIKTSDMPVRIYIHQSKTWDWGNQWFNGEGYEFLRRRIPISRRDEALFPIFPMFAAYKKKSSDLASTFGIGAIIGEVTIVDCVRDSKSVWAVPGLFHFILKDPCLYARPIPYPGRLGFFNVPDLEKYRLEANHG